MQYLLLGMSGPQKGGWYLVYRGLGAVTLVFDIFVTAAFPWCSRFKAFLSKDKSPSVDSKRCLVVLCSHTPLMPALVWFVIMKKSFVESSSTNISIVVAFWVICWESNVWSTRHFDRRLTLRMVSGSYRSHKSRMISKKYLPDIGSWERS